MSPPVQAHIAVESAEDGESPRSDEALPPTAEDPEVNLETIAIELNFNAFADHVPPTRHARRVATPTDPSIQDFADQALELATLRAELKRLTRDYDTLQNAMRVRDIRMQALQDELALARRGLRSTTQQLSDAQSQLASMGSKSAPESPAASALAASTVVMEAMPETAACETPQTPTLKLPDLSQTMPDVSSSTPDVSIPGRRLVPLDHRGDAVILTRDIMTIGRTRANDICIPSNTVSRDHARLLIAPRSVTIVDMSSANGCFVNDEPVSKHRLRNGDVLRLGDRSYRFMDCAAK